MEAAKSTWDKAALAAANANSKGLDAIFFGVSPDEFHRKKNLLYMFMKTRYSIL